MLGSVDFTANLTENSIDTVVIADLEAGIGTLTRLSAHSVDAVVVVVEPTPRSIDVAQRAVELAQERQQGRVVIAANRITCDEDVERIALGIPGFEMVVVPYDAAIMDADRQGVSPLDSAPDTPGVVALKALAQLLRPDQPAAPSPG